MMFTRSPFLHRIPQSPDHEFAIHRFWNGKSGQVTTSRSSDQISGADRARICPLILAHCKPAYHQDQRSKPIQEESNPDQLTTWRTPSFDSFAVQAEVETLPLRFVGDAQADRDVNDLEDNVAADATDKQRSQHTIDLDHQVRIDAADILDVEHSGQDRADDPADAVHTERIQRVVVAEHLFHRRRGQETEYACRDTDDESARNAD